MVAYSLSILLLAAIGAKLIGPYGGLQVDKETVTEVARSVGLPYYVMHDISEPTRYREIKYLLQFNLFRLHL